MRLSLLSLAVLAVPYAAAQSAAPPSDIDQIEAVIGLYFEGHATGVGNHFERAFHPDAQMYSAGDDGLRQTALRTWWEGPDGQPANDEADRHRRIVSVDVSGSVATAKLELDYPGALIYDYMVLVKTDGRWQIVTKAFSVATR